MSVAIVGAGISGLSCGYWLKGFVKSKVELDIFEARNKIGGRTQQVVDADFIDPLKLDLDMGGQDIFFAERSEYKQLLKGSKDKNNFENNFDNVAWTAEAGATLLDCRNGFPCGAEVPFDRDLGDSSFKDASLATFVERYLYPPVQSNVDLDTEIVTIDYSHPDKIVVTNANGDSPTEYDQLVVAVPLSTLQTMPANITFIPPLSDFPKYNTAIQSQPIFTGVRIWIEFESDFYSDATYFKGDFPNENRTFDAVRGYTNPDGKNIMTIQGNRNEYYVDLSDADILEEVLDDLDAAYGGAARENYIAGHYYVRNYKNEKYIEMSTKNSRESPDIEIFKYPLDGRIWFVGDYTRPGDRGNEAGISGMEVAKLVRNKFRCNKSCKANGCCKDNNKWKTIQNGVEQGCDWVAEDRFSRCYVMGFNANGAEKKAKQACPRACKKCLGVCPL